jgi:hypothetical protein
MENDLHSHYYEGITDLAFNHSHKFLGETSREQDFSTHIHYMSGYTTITDHIHYYSLIAYPSTGFESGHVHYFFGYTTEDNIHYHEIAGNTYINDFHPQPKRQFTVDEAKKAGEQLAIDWSKFDVNQYTVGLNVELEHGRINPNTNITNDDLMLTAKIALAHLNEFPDYYVRLTKMEDEAEDYFKQRVDRD